MFEIGCVVERLAVSNTFHKVWVCEVVEANGRDIRAARLNQFGALCGKNTSIDEYLRILD